LPSWLPGLVFALWGEHEARCVFSAALLLRQNEVALIHANIRGNSTYLARAIVLDISPWFNLQTKQNDFGSVYLSGDAKSMTCLGCLG
jgi:hypothetical protein